MMLSVGINNYHMRDLICDGNYCS